MKDMLINGKNRVAMSIEFSNLLMGLASEFRNMTGGSGGMLLMITKLPEIRKDDSELAGDTIGHQEWRREENDGGGIVGGVGTIQLR